MLTEPAEDVVNSVLEAKLTLHELVGKVAAAGTESEVERGAKLLYLCALARVGQLLRGPAPQKEMQASLAALLRAEAWLRSRANLELATRIASLYDLMEDKWRVEAETSEQQLLQRAHVSRLLLWLHGAGGTARREDARNELKLKEANFTRLLNLLEASHVIARRIEGKERALLLTERGRKVIKNYTSSPPDDSLGAVAQSVIQLGSRAELPQISMTTLGKIERDLINMKEVAVICSRIDSPDGWLAEAVTDNFSEHVHYDFFVSRDAFDEAQTKSQQVFHRLWMRLPAAKRPSHPERLFSIHKLPLNYTGFPYVYHMYAKGKKIGGIAWRGSAREVGIANSYEMVPAADAYSMFSIMVGQTHNKPRRDVFNESMISEDTFRIKDPSSLLEAKSDTLIYQ